MSCFCKKTMIFSRNVKTGACNIFFSFHLFFSLMKPPPPILLFFSHSSGPSELGVGGTSHGNVRISLPTSTFAPNKPIQMEEGIKSTVILPVWGGKEEKKKKKKLAGKCCRCRQFRFHFRIDFPITHKSGLGYINTYHKRGNGGGSFGKFCCALSPPDFNIWKETKFSSVFCLFLTVDREGNGWWFSCCRHIVCDALVLSLVAGQHVPNNQITRLFNVNPIFFVWHMTN